MRTPNKIDRINQEWQSAYEHFRQRMNERYQKEITFPEYVYLCKKPLDRIFSDNPKTSIGWLHFRDKDILVVKDRKTPRRLRTALVLQNRIVIITSPHTGKPMQRKAKKVNMEFKGDHFIIDFVYFYCPDTGTEYTDEQTDAMNLKKVYMLYAKKYNVPLEQVMPPNDTAS